MAKPVRLRRDTEGGDARTTIGYRLEANSYPNMPQDGPKRNIPSAFRLCPFTIWMISCGYNGMFAVGSPPERLAGDRF